ncbi:MAG: cyclopropane fatty acyl phospholipid synthase [bacterium]|nr:cyclopropane fatty acyl phospholipid synthase [bacterium]
MPKSRYQAIAEELFARADVRVNGGRPWDIQVHDPRFFRRVLGGGSLAFGESYMDGWWDCDALDDLIARLLAVDLDRAVRTWRAAFGIAVATIVNQQSRRRAFQIGERHYDIGNDLYTAMLGRTMAYSCGYWATADTLDAAQDAKLDLICRKIGLQRGQRVLDIGCGWGSFMKFVAERYGASVVGITVSKEQATLARQRCSGVPIEIRLQVYRDLNERFDHVVSVGMFEHVGYKNYRTFMDVVRRCLKDDGLFLLHTIAGNRSVRRSDTWITRYIFPNSVLPSVAQIGDAIEGRFVMEDWHNFSADYDRTLMAWHANFTAAWPTLKEQYGERFGRMWRYYLLSCAGTFRSRQNQLWQIVLSPSGVRGGHRSVR